MNDALQINLVETTEGQSFLRDASRGRPIAVNQRGQRIAWKDLPDTAYPKVQTPNGMMVNSVLRKDEWELLDAAVVEEAAKRLVGVADLIARGLTVNTGSLGVLISEYNRSSQMTAATVSMDGATTGDEDRVDYELAGVPVPIIHKSYRITERELAASRLGGSDIDTTNAREASRVVSEKIEDMLFNGDSLRFNTRQIFGYTTQTNRNTDTATNYGGGDWGTLSNITPTIEGAIDAAAGDNYHGPYGIYAFRTQYNQAVNQFYTDGSGNTGADRILRMSNVEFLKPSDWLSAGEVVIVQMDNNVVDIAGLNLGSMDAMIQNAEWTSPDGMIHYFKVFLVAVPRVKEDYSSQSGIVHITGA